MKFILKKGMGMRTLDEGSKWLEVVLTVLLIKNKTTEYEEAKAYIRNMTIVENYEESSCSDEFIDLPLDSEDNAISTIKDSCFFQHYSPVFDMVRKSLAQRDSFPLNDFYSPTFAKLLMEKYIPIIAIWSAQSSH